MTALAHHRRESVCQSESDGFMEEGEDESIPMGSTDAFLLPG